jgi:hypothetical protein
MQTKPAIMATTVKEVGAYGLNGLFHSLSAVGGAALTVAVGARHSASVWLLPHARASNTHALSDATKFAGELTRVVVTTVVEKTAGETSQTAAFVRGTLEATGSVGASMLDIADEGVRGAGEAGKVVAATAVSYVGGVATDVVVATGSAVTHAVIISASAVSDKVSESLSKSQ